MANKHHLIPTDAPDGAINQVYQDLGGGEDALKVYLGGASTAGILTTTNQSKAVAAGDCKVDAAANAAATITLADPGTGVSNIIGAVYWSYNNTPTAGKLTLADNGTTVFEVDITVAGPGFFEFPEPLKFTAHTATTITLAAGGSGVTGKITARRWTE